MPCPPPPVSTSLAIVSCPEEFSMQTGGTCTSVCLDPQKPFPSVDTMTCGSSGWNATLSCSSIAPSCSAAVETNGAGVYEIRDIGEVYCDEDGFGIFMSTKGSSSSARYYDPETQAASSTFTLANMGIPSPTNPSGQLKYSHVPAGTPIRMKCSTNSGSSWSTFDVPDGFTDYTANDKAVHTNDWGVISIANVRTRHNASICGPSVSSDRVFSGVGLCNGNPVGWSAVKACAWSTTTGEMLGCNGITGLTVSTSRFMFMMKV
eukprot:TRINITY_DN333_c0_g1_i2.p1 TRINITY_DN333_c0_g1~~TRINITY_DN333_c0_g1_i2.p1  ORF type:complete len:304 (-),score=27.30 TRINITY_DN333_c0_g1_i2:16-801(-)